MHPTDDFGTPIAIDRVKKGTDMLSHPGKLFLVNYGLALMLKILFLYLSIKEQCYEIKDPKVSRNQKTYPYCKLFL